MLSRHYNVTYVGEIVTPEQEPKPIGNRLFQEFYHVSHICGLLECTIGGKFAWSC